MKYAFHRFIVAVLLTTLSFQAVASTLMDLCRAHCQDVMKLELSQNGSLYPTSISFAACNSSTGLVKANLVSANSVSANSVSVNLVSSEDSLMEIGSCNLCTMCIHVVYAPTSVVVSLSGVGPEVHFVAAVENNGSSDPERPFKPPRA
jgi:hypothetical protein